MTKGWNFDLFWGPNRTESPNFNVSRLVLAQSNEARCYVNNFIACWGASYIRDLTVAQTDMLTKTDAKPLENFEKLTKDSNFDLFLGPTWNEYEQGKSEGFDSCKWTSNLAQFMTKIDNFLSCMTLKFDGWPWKTIGHLFYTQLSIPQQALCIISKPWVNWNWSYSRETDKLVVELCDLDLFCHW